MEPTVAHHVTKKLHWHNLQSYHMLPVMPLFVISHALVLLLTFVC